MRNSNDVNDENSSSQDNFNYLEDNDKSSSDGGHQKEIKSRNKYYSQQFPQTFEGTLQKYKNLIMGLQKILLWKRPAILAGIIFAIDAIILLSYYYEVGVCAFVVLCVLIAYVSVYLYFRFNVLLKTEVFDDRPEEEGKLDDLYSFEELCAIITNWRSKILVALNFLNGRNFGEGYIRVILTIGLWLLIAVVMIFIGNIWTLLLVIDILLILPGLFGSKKKSNKTEKKQVD